MALTARELEMNERARQDAWHRQNLEARKKFNESRLAAAHNDPGRYSPWEQRAMDEERRTISLRQHEMDMADKKYASDLALAKEKTLAAGEAARQKGLADIELSKLTGGYTDDKGVFHPGSQTILERERIQAGLTQAENEMATRQRLAEIEDQGRDRDSQRRYGFFDKDGNYIGGSDFNTADVAGEHQARAEASRAAAEREMRLMGLQSRERIAERNNLTKLQLADMKAALNDDKARSRVVEGILKGDYPDMTAADWQKMTREDQDNWLRSMALELENRTPIATPAAGAAGTGQGTAQPQGGGEAFDAADAAASLAKKGYKWTGNRWAR